MTRSAVPPKKVGTLNHEGSNEEKQTNEIGMAMPRFDACDIAGRDITADALLTQWRLAEYIVEHEAHYHFTAKDNQKILAQDIRLHFKHRGEPDDTQPPQCAHGRIEQRRIWCSTALNNYLDFPHVGQVWLIERDRTDKKTGQHSRVPAALGAHRHFSKA
jgi:predicted transposase YbfD/YdcC